jgi:hypothetical protein
MNVLKTDIQRPGKIEARQGGCVEACLNQLSGFDVSYEIPLGSDSKLISRLDVVLVIGTAFVLVVGPSIPLRYLN